MWPTVYQRSYSRTGRRCLWSDLWSVLFLVQHQPYGRYVRTQVNAWQERSLEGYYLVMFVDCVILRFTANVRSPVERSMLHCSLLRKADAMCRAYLIENLNGKIRKYTKSKFSFPWMMLSKRPYIFHLWRLRRNGHNLFITGAWLWTAL